VKEQFAEVPFRLSCLKAQARRDGYAGVSGRNLQFIDSPNLLTDELAQLGGAVALSVVVLSGRDSARQGKKQ
jgi:hypothetical protein